MNPQEIEKALAQTLQDFRLTDGERRALSELLADQGLDEHKRAVYRAMAFDLAGRTLIDPEGKKVLGWLEAVNKLLLPKSDDKPASTEAFFTPEQDGVAPIAALFKRIRKTADVCVFTITDDRISAAILEAGRRGIALRIITDDEKSLDPGSDVQRFREAGITVRTDRSEHHMHHKYAVFDGAVVLTGSYNWTRGAAMNNKENYIVTDDKRLAGSFQRNFDRLWKELA